MNEILFERREISRVESSKPLENTLLSFFDSYIRAFCIREASVSNNTLHENGDKGGHSSTKSFTLLYLHTQSMTFSFLNASENAERMVVAGVLSTCGGCRLS